jgi:hypothetical protein
MPVDVQIDNVEPQPLSRETNRLLLHVLKGALQDVMACIATVVEDDTKQRLELSVPPSTPTLDRSTMLELSVPPSTPTLDRSTMKEPLKTQGAA